MATASRLAARIEALERIGSGGHRIPVINCVVGANPTDGALLSYRIGISDSAPKMMRRPGESDDELYCRAFAEAEAATQKPMPGACLTLTIMELRGRAVGGNGKHSPDRIKTNGGSHA